MNIEMPSIVFWGILLIAYWIITNLLGRDKEMVALPFYLLGFLLTITYLVYLTYWIYSHWNNLPINIHLT
jgi:hypothetical protein